MALWNTFKNYLIEDYVRRSESQQNAERKTFIIIKKILASVGKLYADIGLPDIGQEEPDVLVDHEERNEARESSNRNVALLNSEQITVFNKVMNAIFDDDEKCRLFYVDGPGGTRKAFVYNTILDALYGSSVELTSVAWTGSAAILLRKI